MTDKKIQLILEAKNTTLNSTLDQSERKVKTFGRSVKHVFSEVNRVVDAANKTFGTFGKIATALGTGVVLKKLFSLEEFTKIDDALLRMQANLGMSARELLGFKDKLSTMAGTAGEDMGTLYKNAEKLSTAYKPDDILKIMDASTMASDAMGEDLDMVTDRIVQLMKIYKKTPEEAKKVAEGLVASRVDIGMLDVMLQRGILKGGAGKDYQDVLAMAGGLKKAGVESSRVVMMVETVMMAIEDKKEALKAGGIDLFKIDKTTGAKVKKDYVEIIEELGPALKKARKKFTDDASFNKAIDETFGESAHYTIPFLISQLGMLKKAKEDQANAAQIAGARAAKANETWGEQLNKIKGHLAKIKSDMSWIYDLAKKPVKFLADSPNLTKGLGYGAAGLSLAVLGGMAYGKGKEFLKNYRGTAAGIAEGKAIEAATGVAPVFVTNWPATFGAGLPGLPTGGVGGKFRAYGKYVLPLLPPILAYEWMRSRQAEARGENDLVTPDPEWISGKLNMPKMPGGTSPVNPASMLNNLHVTVNIDKDGRVSTDSDSTNTKIKVNRGDFGLISRPTN